MFRPLSELSSLAIVASVLMILPCKAQGRDRTKVGTLTCDISAGIGLIVTSKKKLTCIYTPMQPGPREVYTGSITKYGLDVGATSHGEMLWSVFAPGTIRFGAVAGQYGGAGAEASVGAGLGANLLVGGSGQSVTLQPVTAQGQSGLNLAIGVTGIDLYPAR